MERICQQEFSSPLPPLVKNGSSLRHLLAMKGSSLTSTGMLESSKSYQLCPSFQENTTSTKQRVFTGPLSGKKKCQDLGKLQLNNNYPKLSKRIQHVASTNETKTDPSSEIKSRFKDTSRTCLLTGHLVIIQ